MDYWIPPFTDLNEAIISATKTNESYFSVRIRNENGEVVWNLDRVPYSGKIIRIEPDGFGIIEFDSPIPNTHGMLSPLRGYESRGKLKAGDKVIGDVQPDPDPNKFAVIKVIVQKEMK